MRRTPAAHVSPGRLAGAATAVLVLALASALLRLAAPGDVSAEAMTEPSTSVVMTAPEVVVAGDPVTLALQGLPDRAVGIVLSGTAGAHAATVVGVAGMAEVVVPAPMARVRGVVTVHVDGRLIGRVDIAPGTAVRTLTPYVGPRSIVTGGEDHTMVTVIPVDDHGNPVAEDTLVTVTADRVDGERLTEAVRTDGLLGWVRITSGTRAGRTQLRALTAGTSGPVADVLEVAGRPVPFALVVDAADAPADGRTTVAVSTTVLRDAFGNLLTDGTAVVFEVDGPDGFGQVQAVTVAGIASAQVRAPGRPGALEVRAHVLGVTSDPASLAFASAVASIPVTARVVDGRLLLDVGPVLDPQGSHVPNGTAVVVSAGSLTRTARLVDGSARFDLPAPVGRVRVEVGGRSVEVTP